MTGIIRLGLARVVVRERDRFAGELAARAMRHLPDAERADLEKTMRTLADTTMGPPLAELEREGAARRSRPAAARGHRLAPGVAVHPRR